MVGRPTYAVNFDMLLVKIRRTSALEVVRGMIFYLFFIFHICSFSVCAEGCQADIKVSVGPAMNN